VVNPHRNQRLLALDKVAAQLDDRRSPAGHEEPAATDADSGNCIIDKAQSAAPE